MIAATPQLSLGTAQFGLAYGIAGSGVPVGSDEARRILERASSIGIRFVDTAPAYGDIEQRLGPLCAGLDLRFVSKIGTLAMQTDPANAAELVMRGAELSMQRLGAALDCLLFHNGEDLLGPAGDAVWSVLEKFSRETGVRLGVSCYGPTVLQRVLARYPVKVAQLPGNALDQRVASGLSQFGDVELHLRSAFLQGLLLMPEDAAVARLPVAADELRRWHEWLAGRRLDPLRASLSLVKGLPGVAYCVVGVESLIQLNAIIEAWNLAQPVRAPELGCARPEVIDPRRWRVAS